MVLSRGLKLCYSSLPKNITAQVRLKLVMSLRLADLELQIRLSGPLLPCDCQVRDAIAVCGAGGQTQGSMHASYQLSYKQIFPGSCAVEVGKMGSVGAHL